MKKSVIKDIFNGLKGHVDTMIMPIDNKSLSIICDTYNEFKNKLSSDLIELYEKLEASLDNQHTEEVEFFFAEGFKLGLQIGIECMEK